MGGGLSYTILYGEEPWDCGVILSLSRAVGNKSAQEQSVSKIHLETVSLSVWLVPSTIPELWGLYAICNFHLMFKVLLTCCTKSATKAGSLSEPMLVKVKSLSRVRLFATLWTEAYQLLRPWGFPGKSTGVGCHRLLQWFR